MRLLPYGPHAVLVELDSAADRADLVRRIDRHPIAGVVEHVPAAQTVLLVLDDTADPDTVAATVRTLPPAPPVADTATDTITIEVTYDGPDLAEVARLLDTQPEEVIRRHTGQLWTCEFVGFLPGFGYLSGADDNLTVPRRDSPRTRIPAGAVALAAGWSAVYPSASPGGWQLIGSTSARLFDVHRDPPGLLRAGTGVRFVDTS